MSLIDCPGCGHKVMNVASVCPHCSFSLSEHRVIEAHRSSGTRCANCHHAIPAGATQCPHCHSARHGKRTLWWITPAALVVLIAAVTFFITRREQQPTAQPDVAVRSDTPLADAARESELADSVPPPLSPAVTQAPQAPAAEYHRLTRWTSTWVNVREDRSVNAAVLRILTPGQRVDVADQQRGWWAAYLDGQMIGYLAGSTLRDEPPEP